MIALGIVTFLVWSELGSQDCTDQVCHNKLPPIEAGDSNKDIVDKIRQGVKNNHCIVTWRRAMLVAIVISAIIVVIYSKCIPHGFDFFMIAVIVFLTLYFSSAWIQSHWFKMNDHKIEKSLRELRERM